MIIKNILFIFLFGLSNLVAMDKIETDKEVEAFKLRLQQATQNTQHIKPLQLDRKSYKKVVELCKKELDKNKKNIDALKKNIEVRTANNWHATINELHKNLTPYKNHKNLGKELNEIVIDALDCLEKNLTFLEKTIILNKEQMQTTAQAKLLGLLAIQKAKEMVRAVNKQKVHTLRRFRSQLRQKPFRSKV